MIELYDVWKTYGKDVHALKRVSTKISKGEFVYVVGASGAGKSTFIKMLYREIKPTKGAIFVNGFNVEKIRQRQIPMIRRTIGVVFQDYKLLPNMSAYENVAFAMEVIETPRKQIRPRVMEILAQVGLSGKEKSRPHELSGGEQQRVSIARALVNKPTVIIADEPTGNLDPRNSWEIIRLLEDINNRGTTVIMATHNRDVVDVSRRRVIEFVDGEIVRDERRGGYSHAD